MIFSIKKAEITDLEILNRLMYRSKSYWGYSPEFLDKFMSLFNIKPTYLAENTIYLFYIDDELAGFYNFVSSQEDDLELDNFWLHPDFIGNGLGRELWRACLHTAKSSGKKEFTIWSEPYAEGFYLKMGCVRIGTRASPMLPDRFPPVLKYTLS